MAELLKRTIRSNRKLVFLADIGVKLRGVGTEQDLLLLTDQLGNPFTLGKLAASQDLDTAIANGDVDLFNQNGVQVTGVEAIEATNLLTLHEFETGTATVEDLPDLGDVDALASPTLGSLLRGDGAEWDEFGIGSANQFLGVDTGGTDLEYKTFVAGANITITPAAGSVTIAASGSSTTFLGLTDVDEATYTGQAGLVPVVKGAEDGLEFQNIPGVGSKTQASGLVYSMMLMGG